MARMPGAWPPMPRAEAVTSCRPAATGVPAASPVGRRPGGDLAGDLGGAGDRRQGPGEGFEAEEAEGVGSIVLGADVGEGGAGLGAVGADGAGQAEAQPVLAGEGGGDAGVAVGLVVADPGEQRRGGGGVRQLAGERERLGRRPGRSSRPRRSRRRGCRARGWRGRAGGGRRRAGRGRRRGRWRRLRRCRTPGGRWRRSPRGSPRRSPARGRPCRARRGGGAASTAARGGGRRRAGGRRRRRPPPW